MPDKEISIRITARNLTEAEFAKARAGIAGLTEAATAGAGATHSYGGAMSSFANTVAGVAGGFVSAQAVMRGASAAFGFVKDAVFGMNASLETSTLQFTTLMGDADKARAHVKDLFTFAKDTPFETGPIIDASKALRTAGGDALDTNRNLTLLGDAAAATGAPINELGMWVGRMYAAMQAGRPFGEATQRLGELMVISPQVRNQLEGMQKAGASGDAMFRVFTDSLGKFSGAMKAQASTWSGVTSTLSDTVNILLADTFKPFFEIVRDGIGLLNEGMGGPTAQAAMTSFKLGVQGAVGTDSQATVQSFALRIVDLGKTLVGVVEAAMVGFNAFQVVIGDAMQIVDGVAVAFEYLALGIAHALNIASFGKAFNDDITRINANLDSLMTNIVARGKALQEDKKAQEEWHKTADGLRGMLDGLGVQMRQNAADTKTLAAAGTNVDKLTAALHSLSADGNVSMDQLKKIGEAAIKSGVDISKMPPELQNVVRWVKSLDVAVGSGASGGGAAGAMLNFGTNLGLTAKEAKAFSAEVTKLSSDVARGLRTLSDSDFAKEFGTKLADANREFEKLGITGTRVPEAIRQGFERLAQIRVAEFILTGNKQAAAEMERISKEWEKQDAFAQKRALDARMTNLSAWITATADAEEERARLTMFASDFQIFQIQREADEKKRALDEHGAFYAEAMQAIEEETREKMAAARAAHNAEIDHMRQAEATWAHEFAGLMESIPGIMMRAFEGGGGLQGALEAIGTNIGTSISHSIFGKGGDDGLSGFGQKLATGAAKMFGPAFGQAIGAVLPGLGAMLGPLIGKLFGGPSELELEGRKAAKSFANGLSAGLTEAQKSELRAAGLASEQWAQQLIVVRDAYAGIGKTAAEAEEVLHRLWLAEKQGPEAVKAVIAEIAPALEHMTALNKELNRVLGTDSKAAMDILVEAWQKLTPAQLEDELIVGRLVKQYEDLKKETGITIEGLDELAQSTKKATGSFYELTDGVSKLQAQIGNLETLQEFEHELENARKGGSYSFTSMLRDFEQLKASLGDTPEIDALELALVQAAATGVFEWEKFATLFATLKAEMSRGINIPISIAGKEVTVGAVDENFIQAHLSGIDYEGGRYISTRPGDAYSEGLADFLNRHPGDEERAERAFGTRDEWESHHTGGWIGVPRAHSGLWMDEVPVIGQIGERMLSRAEVSRMGGRSSVDALAAGGTSQPLPIHVHLHMNGRQVTEEVVQLMPDVLRRHGVRL